MINVASGNSRGVRNFLSDCGDCARSYCCCCCSRSSNLVISLSAMAVPSGSRMVSYGREQRTWSARSRLYTGTTLVRACCCERVRSWLTYKFLEPTFKSRRLPYTAAFVARVASCTRTGLGLSGCAVWWARVSGQLCPVWAVSDCCSLLYLLDLSASSWCS